MSRSPRTILPASGLSRPAIRLSVVLLPQPDGPRSVTNARPGRAPPRCGMLPFLRQTNARLHSLSDESVGLVVWEEIGMTCIAQRCHLFAAGAGWQDQAATAGCGLERRRFAGRIYGAI